MRNSSIRELSKIFYSFDQCLHTVDDYFWMINRRWKNSTDKYINVCKIEDLLEKYNDDKSFLRY